MKNEEAVVIGMEINDDAEVRPGAGVCTFPKSVFRKCAWWISIRRSPEGARRPCRGRACPAPTMRIRVTLLV